ncbi:hypothetical protein [Croceiramulus getboli]|nr:hypothetical protein P8624_10690 [Flavobacteriaceae bacterium YJPT1-3]
MPKPKGDPQKKSNSRSQSSDEDASWIDTDRVVNKAQRIVNSAVNVLEEEIAAGILAAKRIEKKLIDVEEIRSDPDALMNRIRRDSHEVLDLFIDAFASLTGQMNSVIEALKNETEAQAASTKKNKPGKSTASAASLVALAPDEPLKPGTTTSLTLLFQEDSEEKKIELRKADLMGPGDQIINKRALKMEPAVLTLNRKKEGELKLTIKLPKNSQPGHYNALLTDKDDPKVGVLLSLEVVDK